jgi:hypothetical protein
MSIDIEIDYSKGPHDLTQTGKVIYLSTPKSTYDHFQELYLAQAERENRRSLWPERVEVNREKSS